MATRGTAQEWQLVGNEVDLSTDYQGSESGRGFAIRLSTTHRIRNLAQGRLGGVAEASHDLIVDGDLVLGSVELAQKHSDVFFH